MVLSMGQIELFDIKIQCKQILCQIEWLEIELLVHLIVYKQMVWFGFFVWWHINLCRLFNAKAILLEQQ